MSPRWSEMTEDEHTELRLRLAVDLAADELASALGARRHGAGGRGSTKSMPQLLIRRRRWTSPLRLCSRRMQG